VKQAVEVYNKAKEELTQAVDGVRLDVRSTYLSLKSFEQSIQTSSAAVGLAEEDYKIKVIRYQAGVGTNLDVLDAQVALTTAKNNYLQAMYNYNNYLAKLDKSMGVTVN
jgi:outer membrane protein TolC